MLLYHPFFDAQHCVFRILRILEKIGKVEVEVQRMRVWDFYLLLPTALQDAQLPQGHTHIRSLVRTMENRYEVLHDPRRAFMRLEPMQNAALAHLSSVGVISAAQLVEGKVHRTELVLPTGLKELINACNAEENTILDFLTTKFFEIPLYGRKGIRVRTDLFDSRYDIP